MLAGCQLRGSLALHHPMPPFHHFQYHRRKIIRSASIIISAAACSCSAFSTHLSWRSMPQSCTRRLETRFPPLSAHLPDAPTKSSFDIVLSSGHRSFAAHCGFLEAVELTFPRKRVGAVLGTSSGALTGALWAAGYSAKEVAEIIEKHSYGDVGPLGLRVPLRPKALVKRLAPYLPQTFEELPFQLSIGVQEAPGAVRVLRSGSLLEAMMASLAVPLVCEPVFVDGVQFFSMGKRDRTGIQTRFRWQPDRRALVHCQEDGRGWFRSRSRDIGTWVKNPRTIVVRSPRSKSPWWRGLADFERERLIVLKNTLRTIAPEAVHTIPTIYPDEVNPVLAYLDLHR